MEVVENANIIPYSDPQYTYVFEHPGSGSVIICTDPDPNPAPDRSIKKPKNKEILDFHSYVTSYELVIFDD